MTRSHTLYRAATLATVGALVFGFAAVALAESPPKGPFKAAKGCTTAGPALINVEQKVANDVDSGQAGNNWAFDSFERQIKVYDNGDGTFCAEVKYDGKFDSQAGQQSPGNTGVLTGKEDGEFKGGYTATITGSLLASPLWKTKGNVGKFDYQCDILGTCPGYVSWTDQYFTAGYGFDYVSWSWTYKYKKNVWINASSGNSGDVI